MKNKNPIKDISEMTVKELHDWIIWAEKEISEYQAFILDFKAELKNRHIDG